MLVESSSRVRRFLEAGTQSGASIPGAPTSSDTVWRLVTGGETLTFELPAASGPRRALAQHVSTLPAGTMLAVRCTGMGSARRCRRFARDVRLVVIREYLAIPALDPPAYYVEDSTSTLRYFITQLVAVPNGGMAASAALFALKRVAGAFVPATLARMVAPGRIMLARVAATSSAAPALRPRQADEVLDGQHTRTLVLAVSKDPNAKITLLEIPPGSSTPAIAIKLPTTPSAERSVAAEASMLADLEARLPSSILATLPRIQEGSDGPGKPSLVATALPGMPMAGRYHAWRHLATPAAVQADFDAVEAWLAGFQRATAGPRCPIEMDAGVGDALRDRFADDPSFEAAMAGLGAIHARLRMTTTPRTAVHGDFWFGNLLFAGGAVSGVVDWESGASQGEPVRDLVRFALAYALYIDRHTKPGRRIAGHGGLRAGVWGCGIGFAISGEGWFPDLVRRFVSNGLARLGADSGCWREAMVAGIAEVAANADHLDFARRHWLLFDRLSTAQVLAA